MAFGHLTPKSFVNSVCICNLKKKKNQTLFFKTNFEYIQQNKHSFKINSVFKIIAKISEMHVYVYVLTSPADKS